MAITITHATVASDPQDPLLGADEWNANHVVSGFPCLGMRYNDDYYHCYSTTFHEGTTIGDYGMATANSGGAAQLQSNTIQALASDQVGTGHIYFSTNAGATNYGGAFTRAVPNSGVWLAGTHVEANACCLIPDLATETEDFSYIGPWLTNNTAATSSEDVTTAQNAFFRYNRDNANFMLCYVDDSNVQQEIDTGVLVEEDKYYSMTIKVTQGAAIANTVITGFINGVQVGTATGLKAWSTNTVIWPGRIQKFAGTTNRFIWVDRFAYLVYNPSGINAR